MARVSSWLPWLFQTEPLLRVPEADASGRPGHRLPMNLVCAMMQACCR